MTLSTQYLEEEQKQKQIEYEKLHPFQKVLKMIRSQPDLHYVMRAKRIAETGVEKFDFATMLPWSGMSVYVNGDKNQREQFCNTIASNKSWDACIALKNTNDPYFQQLLECNEIRRQIKMTRNQGTNPVDSFLHLLVIIEFECKIERSLLEKLFLNSRHYGMCVIWLYNPQNKPFKHSIPVKGGRRLSFLPPPLRMNTNFLFDQRDNDELLRVDDCRQKKVFYFSCVDNETKKTNEIFLTPKEFLYCYQD